MSPQPSPHPARTNHTALLPWLYAIAQQQCQAWQAARRVAHADELMRAMALQDARTMAKLSRAMTETALKR